MWVSPVGKWIVLALLTIPCLAGCGRTRRVWRLESDLRETLAPPWVRPVRVIEMDSGLGGQWLAAGDLDGDGQVEFLAARNAKQAVTTLSAWKRDGSLLWVWGERGAGSPRLGYDVPVQIHDLDGDGANEVAFSIEGHLVFADGATGREIRRTPLPDGLEVADCIVFANLTGGERAADLIIKDRYERIWAYDRDLRLLWSIEEPGGYRTAHHPEPIDLDGDGRDEVVVGYTAVDDDGTPLWTLEPSTIDIARGHVDCCRVVRRGKRPKDFRLVFTCCSALGCILADGRGRVLREVAGWHFESADVGDVRPDARGPEIIVDVDHRPYGESQTWILSADGRRLCRLWSNYGRHHDLVDWNGDGVAEIVLGHARALCDGSGRRRATFAPEGIGRELAPPGDGDPEPFVFVGDVTGDGFEDVVLHTTERIEIYENPSPHRSIEETHARDGKRKATEARHGTGMNFTLY